MRRSVRCAACLILSFLLSASFVFSAAVFADGDSACAEGHDYVAEEFEPTCTEGGYTAHVCSRCGERYVDSETDPLGHEWDEGVVTRDPTDRDEGAVVYTCLRCGETVTEAVPKLRLDIAARFDDVGENDWFFDAVGYVYANKLMNGTAENLFSPNGVTTRAMVVTVLWRIEGSPTPENGTNFVDLKDDSYLDAVAWAYEVGIVKGYTELRFAPEEPVTREQFCAVLYRYSAFKERDVSARAPLSAFPDEASVSEYARSAVEWAVALGLVSGSNNRGVTVIDPAGYATRAQIAAVMMRYNINENAE